MQPTLLVLAAGMGSRYGGLKQVDPVGPTGETLMDYAVFDALRAGFDRVVFVIRRDFAQDFRDRICLVLWPRCRMEQLCRTGLRRLRPGENCAATLLQISGYLRKDLP